MSPKCPVNVALNFQLQLVLLKQGQEAIKQGQEARFTESMANPKLVEEATYNNRDLLLLTQLLHTKGLIEPDSLKPNDKKLESISKQWFEHQSTQISIAQDHLPLTLPLSGSQVLQLYQNLLANHSECKNTTDLANHFYFTRVEEVAATLELQKAQFRELVDELAQ